MKISVTEYSGIQLEEVYNGITLKNDSGETISICMRDSGFEFNYQGDWYEAKEGKVELMKKTIPSSDKVPSDDQPTTNGINWVETRTL